MVFNNKVMKSIEVAQTTMEFVQEICPKSLNDNYVIVQNFQHATSRLSTAENYIFVYVDCFFRWINRLRTGYI